MNEEGNPTDIQKNLMKQTIEFEKSNNWLIEWMENIIIEGESFKMYERNQWMKVNVIRIDDLKNEEIHTDRFWLIIDE